MNLFFPLSNWFPIKEFDFEEFRVPEKNGCCDNFCLVSSSGEGTAEHPERYIIFVTCATCIESEDS